MACEKCKGTGKVTYRILPASPPVVTASRLVIEDLGGTGTRACECVRDLDAIDGKASWWETERLFGEVVAVPIGDECIEIEVDGEVPRRADGQRVHRTVENAYYPALVRMTVDASASMMHGDTARELAAALLKAADVCDAADAHLRPAVTGAGWPMDAVARADGEAT